MRRGPLITCACVLMLVLAGCSGAGGGADSAEATGGLEEADTAVAEATGTPAATEAADGGGGGSGAGDARDTDGSGMNAQVGNRQLIYEAEVELRVEDFDAASENLTAMVNERGGYVERATRRVRGEENRTWTEGVLVLRVPAGNYTGAMAAVEARGEVRSSSQSARDVTNQIVDLEARLESLRAERDRLRQLYRRANDTEEVLAVQRELSEVQTEIERTEARLQSLERQVAFATIVVKLSEPRPDYEPPERSQWYETPFVEAFLESVDGVIVVGRALVVLTAYALPYLLALAVPAVVLGAGLWVTRGRWLDRIRG